MASAMAAWPMYTSTRTAQQPMRHGQERGGQRKHQRNVIPRERPAIAMQKRNERVEQHYAKPILSRTMRIVSRAMSRHFRAAVAKTSSMRPGSRRSDSARGRIGTNSVSIESASTRLQSMHPQPAVVHFVATCVTVSAALTALWGG